MAAGRKIITRDVFITKPLLDLAVVCEALAAEAELVPDVTGGKVDVTTAEVGEILADGVPASTVK